MKVCSKCNEDWPATREFFFSAGGRLRSDCKACYLEDRKKRKAQRSNWGGWLQ